MEEGNFIVVTAVNSGSYLEDMDFNVKDNKIHLSSFEA